MKILTICNLYPPNVVGGAEILTKNLVDTLRNKHQILVLTSSCGESFPPHVLSTLKRWDPDNPPSLMRRLQIQRENKYATQKALHDLNPDVVLISDLKGISYAPLRVAQQTKPTVTFLHDKYSFAEARPTSISGNVRKFIGCLAIYGLPICLKNVLANSQTTLDTQPSFITIQKSTIVRVGIPHPLKLDKNLCKGQTEKNRKQILYFGRITPEKGVHLTIEALNLIRKNQGDNNIHLIIAGYGGDARYSSYLQLLVEQYNLGAFVFFRNNVSEQEKYQYFYASDVFVFPSLWEEGLGQTYLEAMSCGLPCVCAAAGGAKEILENESNCLLIDPNDVDQMAQAIHRILFDQSLRESIAQQGRHMVEHEYYITAFAQRCLTVLENCTLER